MEEVGPWAGPGDRELLEVNMAGEWDIDIHGISLGHFEYNGK